MVGFAGATTVVATAVTIATACAETIRVTSPADAGPGTLRDAIERANASTSGATIQIALGRNGLIVIDSALPALAAPGIQLDGGGATLRDAPDCVRPDGKKGCDGIVVTGPRITVRDLAVGGFLFDGVAVRGAAAQDVRIERVVAFDNFDDGIGVSEGAGPVHVADCLMMGNGFRTKGKGLLVFDGARATLTGSVVVGNRDGVTVTKGSSLELQSSVIAGSFDKGLGAGDGRIIGSGNLIVANGTGEEFEEAVPNGDGLRLSLQSRVELRDSHIDGNGDAGVVALDGSSVVLQGGSVAANAGYGVVAGKKASITAAGVSLENNGKGEADTVDGGKAKISAGR